MSEAGEKTATGYMPLMGTGLAVRMSLLNEQWAQRNHGQTLAELRSRGGLSPCEAAAIADQRTWRQMGHAVGLEFLLKLALDHPSQAKDR